MGNDLQKGTIYATGGSGGQGTITSSNLNAHVDDAIIKPTFVTAKAARTPGVFTDQILLESGGALYKMLLSTLRDLLVPPGSVIQNVYGDYTANAALTAIIPSDDTIPQITEGTEIISVSITPRFSTSKIYLHFSGTAAAGTSGVGISTAIFRNPTASALVSNSNFPANPTDFLISTVLQFYDSPGSTSAQTYSVRAGPGFAGTIRFNGFGTASGRVHGGAMHTILTLMEIKQ